MDGILSPLAFFVLIVAQCAAVAAVHAMKGLGETHRVRRTPSFGGGER